MSVFSRFLNSLSLRLAAGAVSLSSSLSAMPGEQLYTMYCSGCHGADGKGVAGAAPPLAHSGWVNGRPERMAQILIHGIQGDMTVLGERYNLVMPPQVALNDEQIASVMNYVRNSWTNVGKEVDAGFVARQRTAPRVVPFKGKEKTVTGMWSAPDLARVYPLTNHPTKLIHLLSERYKYTDDLTALGTMKPMTVEEEEGGLFRPEQCGKTTESFSAIWRGGLKVNRPAEYRFVLAGKEAAQLLLNGDVIAERGAGDASPSVVLVNLEKGEAKFELRYTHQKGQPFDCRVYWSGPGFEQRHFHDISKLQRYPSFRLKHELKRPIVHRNFFKNKISRALVVGFPEGMNFVFDADTTELSQLWQGEFIDPGNTWHGRARGEFIRPSESVVTILNARKKGNTFRVGSHTSTPVDSSQLQFVEYTYDAAGSLTFHYHVGSAAISETYAVSKDGKTLSRTIKTSELNDALYMQLVRRPGSKTPPYDIGGGATLDLGDYPSTAIMHDDGLVIQLLPSRPVTLTYTFN